MKPCFFNANSSFCRMANPIHWRGLLHLSGIVLHPALKYLANAGQPRWLEVLPKTIRFLDYCLFTTESKEKQWILLLLYCLIALTLFLSVNSLHILVVWGRKESRTRRWLDRSLKHIHPPKGGYSFDQPESRADVVVDMCWVSSLRIHDTLAYGLMLYFTGIQFLIIVAFIQAVKFRNFSLICLTLGSTLLYQAYESPTELKLKACFSNGFCAYSSPNEEIYAIIVEYMLAMFKKLSF